MVVYHTNRKILPDIVDMLLGKCFNRMCKQILYATQEPETITSKINLVNYKL